MNPFLHLFRTGLSTIALGTMLTAQSLETFPAGADRTILPARRAAKRQHAEATVAERLLNEAAGRAPDRLLFDQPGDGRLWAVGTTYKASFGADGFVYVPFLGSEAPRNFPIQFVLRSVRIGGQPVAFAADAAATRNDARVTFDRGAVREVYDLTPRGVEQTFVVDGSLPGDVDVELEVVTELIEDAATAGLQFGNELGSVEYGTAYLVCGEAKSEIPATLAGRSLRLHVPAAQRGAGAVVIDPIIRTVTLTPTTMTSEIPDVAYDATTDRWGIAWVHVFSQTDHDVVFELRAGNGDSLAGSFRPIDGTSTSFSWPRVANLNSADRFLVAMERYEPSNPAGQQYSIWGRTVDAVAPFNMGSLNQISPSSTQDQLSVDVGGDSGTGTKWLVVWRHGTDIHGRQVSANGAVDLNTIPIESGPAVCISPQISLSNGNGLTATPRWCVVYTVLAAPTNGNVNAAVVDQNGVITTPDTVINNVGGNDQYTYVSSPMTAVANGPLFLVSWERQVTPAELMVKVVDAGLNTIVPPVNLTRQFGFTGIYTRVESDGVRFAVTCQAGTALRVGTLALVNNSLVLHEELQSLGTGDSPALASKRSGGGGTTDYGIVFDTTNPPARVNLALYQGRAPAGGFVRRSTGCGLGINQSGRPYLGDVIHFTLSSGTDVPLLLLGAPAPAVPLCANCSLGVDPLGPLMVFMAPLSLPLPSDPILVGFTMAVQGVAIGSGSCPGPLRLSDTVDFTIQ